MAVYYILIFVIILFGILQNRFLPTEQAKKVYCIGGGIALALISSLRFMVSTDYYNYWEGFLQSYFLSWEDFSYQRFEKGYLAISRLLSGFTLGYNILFVAFAILFAAVIACFIYRRSANAWVSFTAFVCFGFLYNSMCFLRQYTALMIMLFAFKYVEQRRFFRFAIFVLLASTFHISAIVMLPFYFILRIPMNRMTLPIALVLCGIALLGSETVLGMVTKVAYKQHGLTSVEVIHGTSPGPGIAFLVFLVICLVLYKPLVQRRPYNTFLINLLYWGTFFELVGIKHAIVSRLALFFMTPAVILLVAELVELFKKNIQSITRSAGQSLAVVVLIYALLLTPMLILHQHLLDINYNGVVPYQSVFSEAFRDY
ncbi:EpsG family protein [Oscillospiraceae bacterium LTW-04]|nr:EpsG family protein [Oscillospiraceae bacterium MB24-C1]